MIEKIKEDAAEGVQATPTPAPEQKPKEEEGNAYEPKSWEFKVDLPGVTAMDL